MPGIRELVEKTFGKDCFAGFDTIVRETGNRIGIYLGSYNDVKRHKFDVLAQVCVMRPHLTVNEARLCIEHICGMMFTREEFKRAKEYILNNWDKLYNEIQTALEENK